MAPEPSNNKIERTIVVNKNNKSGHQRFTAAHELWHYFSWLHEQTPLKTEFVKCESIQNIKQDEEIIASNFAAELLMPEDKFLHVLNKYNDIMPNTTNLRLMSYFGVTETAVILRRKNLNN